VADLRRLVPRALTAALCLAAAACGAHERPPIDDRFQRTADLAVAGDPPPGLKIAFIGDQGLGSRARGVLQVIENEGAVAVCHQGDFDYDDDPEAWEEQIDAVLGPDFPYFVSVGNHDTDVYYGPGGYQERVAARMDRLGIPWDGDLGVKSTVVFRGLLFVFAAPGVFGQGHAEFIAGALAAHPEARWRVCSWHKNQNAMQTGRKWDEAGWGVYEAARRGGALVMTGHEHAYSRSHLLATCEEEPEVAAREGPLALAVDDPTTPADEGRTVVVVSGIGGKGARSLVRGGDHWACIYTDDQDAVPGALFGEFHVDGDPDLARFYFMNLNGEVVDEYYVRAPDLAPLAPTPSGAEADGPAEAEEPAEAAADPR